MTESSFIETAASLEQLGIVGLLALAVIALIREWVVPGRRLKDAEEQRREAERSNDDLLLAVRTVEDSAKTVVRLVESLPHPTSREEE